MSATVISIINNKGGVGKTTSSIILAEILSYLDKKVLQIDLDGQSNLTMMHNLLMEDSRNVILKIEPPKEENICELFLKRYHQKEEVLNLIKPTRFPGVDLIPSSKRHEKTADYLMAAQTGNNSIILDRALCTIKDDYDYILIDNGPRSDILTVNSMFASDYVIVPVRVEQFSYKGLAETLNELYFIKEEHGIEKPAFLGAFITQAELNTNAYKSMRSQYESELQGKLFKTAIRKDTKIADMETNLSSILANTPNTNAVFDYCELLLEMNILDKESTDLLNRTIGS